MNEEVLMELKILYQKISKTGKPTFGKLLYSITKNLSKSDLFEISDNELIEHIRKVQIIESI